MRFIYNIFKPLNSFLCLLILFTVSCEDYLSDDSFLNNEPESYDGFMANGWENFSSGEYDEAEAAFQSAAERDATQPEVYLGLGWTQLRLMDVGNAESNFQKVISFAFLDENNSSQLTNDANAGLTFIALVNGNYDNILDFGNKVIDNNSNYIFDKDNSINAASVLITMAEAHYYLNQISDAYDISIQLGKSFSTVVTTSDTAIVNQYYDNSAVDGLVKATLINNVHLLISIENATVLGLTYQVAEVYEGTDEFDIIGNPVPNINDAVLINYSYTLDYAEFMVELISKISQ